MSICIALLRLKTSNALCTRNKTMHWAKTLLGVDETDAELLFLASLIDIYGTRSCSVVAGIATTKTLCKARYMLFFKSIFDGVLKVE